MNVHVERPSHVFGEELGELAPADSAGGQHRCDSRRFSGDRRGSGDSAPELLEHQRRQWRAPTESGGPANSTLSVELVPRPSDEVETPVLQQPQGADADAGAGGSRSAVAAKTPPADPKAEATSGTELEADVEALTRGSRQDLLLSGRESDEKSTPVKAEMHRVGADTADRGEEMDSADREAARRVANARRRQELQTKERESEDCDRSGLSSPSSERHCRRLRMEGMSHRGRAPGVGRTGTGRATTNFASPYFASCSSFSGSVSSAEVKRSVARVLRQHDLNASRASNAARAVSPGAEGRRWGHSPPPARVRSPTILQPLRASPSMAPPARSPSASRSHTAPMGVFGSPSRTLVQLRSALSPLRRERQRTQSPLPSPQASPGAEGRLWLQTPSVRVGSPTPQAPRASPSRMPPSRSQTARSPTRHSPSTFAWNSNTPSASPWNSNPGSLAAVAAQRGRAVGSQLASTPCLSRDPIVAAAERLSNAIAMAQVAHDAGLSGTGERPPRTPCPLDRPSQQCSAKRSSVGSPGRPEVAKSCSREASVGAPTGSADGGSSVVVGAAGAATAPSRPSSRCPSTVSSHVPLAAAARLASSQSQQVLSGIARSKECMQVAPGIKAAASYSAFPPPAHSLSGGSSIPPQTPQTPHTPVNLPPSRQRSFAQRPASASVNLEVGCASGAQAIASAGSPMSPTAFGKATKSLQAWHRAHARPR